MKPFNVKLIRTAAALAVSFASWSQACAAAAAPAKSPDAPQTIDAPPEFTQAADVSSETMRRLRWWSEARFGMFLHWGLYAQDGCFWKGQDGKTEHMMRH